METDIDHARYVASLGERLFGVRSYILFRKKEKTVAVVFSSKLLVKFLCDKGLINGNKVKSHLRGPEWIMQKSQYLRGIFDTDGCIFLDKHKIKNRIYAHLGWQFTSAIPELITDIASILQEQGYRFSRPSPGKNIFIRRQGEVNRYFKEIGTSNMKHFDRFLTLRQWE